MQDEEKKLATLHDIIKNAADLSLLENRDLLRPQRRYRGGEIMFAFRVEASVKEQAQAICKSNNINLSVFFRDCARRLVTEYGGN